MNHSFRKLCLFLVLVPGLGTGFTGAAGGAGITRFAIVSRADGIGLRYVDPSMPVVPGGAVSGGAASAMASVDSRGTSHAFASAPYPGDFLVTLPGTLNGLFGSSGAPPLPAYPFIVSSSHPTDPQKDAQQGPYALSAHSEEAASRAEARLGALTGDPSLAAAVSSVSVARDVDTDRLTATATSRSEALALGSVLTIGRVSSTVRAVASPDHQTELSTSTSVGTVMIGDTEFGLTDRGLVGPGGPVGLDPEQAQTVLAQAGITLRYIPAERSHHSITSASVEVGLRQEVPGRGLVELTLTLGRVIARSEPLTGGLPSEPDLAPPAGLDLPAAPSSVTDDESGSEPQQATPAVAIGLGGTSGFEGTTEASSAGSTSVAPGSVDSGTAPQGEPTALSGSALAAPQPTRLADGSALYLVLLSTGGLLFAGSRLTGHLAIRTKEMR